MTVRFQHDQKTNSVYFITFTCHQIREGYKMSTESVSGNQTKVTLSNASTLKYPLNILLLMVEKGIAKDMDKNLSCLKTILEK